MKPLRYVDLHCHPNLKTFGHSFGNKPESVRSSLWYHKHPTRFDKMFTALTGLCKYTQADLVSMQEGKVKLALVSLYPFEKGFFVSGDFNGPVTAWLADGITSIGYSRVRHLQRQSNYFKALCREMDWLVEEAKRVERHSHGKCKSAFVNSLDQLHQVMSDDATVGLIPTIEGGHVLGCGLERYGRRTNEEEVLSNLDMLLKWECPPLFITLAHNFYNDLCGHARSLTRLGKAVNQSQGLDEGFTPLGVKVVHRLLTGIHRPVWIDVKHMSVKSRLEYYGILQADHKNVPIVVSHGAVTGVAFGHQTGDSIFCADDINFYDEELICIYDSGGMFALQLDANRLAKRRFLKRTIKRALDPMAIHQAARVVWEHVRHIATVLDRQGRFGWGTACIGSDFDGTINPLQGVWSSASLPLLADRLLKEADDFLKSRNSLTVKENREITPEEVVERFAFSNAFQFVKKSLR
jgi:microsomal dipeptidase-like Zn-dependent dipeptidase